MAGRTFIENRQAGSVTIGRMEPSPTGTARPRLVPRPGAAIVVATVAWAVLAVMGWWLHDSRDPTGFDTDVHTWLFRHTGSSFAQVTLALSEPALSVGCCVLVGLGAALVRRWDVVALAVLGPAAGLVLESHVLKPGIDRLYGYVETASRGAVKAGYAFPSGHQTGLVCALMLLLIPLLASRSNGRVKTSALVVATLWAFFGAAGLVRNDYHYATDTVGGTCLGVALMLTVALAIDRVGRWLNSPGGRDRTRTAHAA